MDLACTPLADPEQRGLGGAGAASAVATGRGTAGSAPREVPPVVATPPGDIEAPPALLPLDVPDASLAPSVVEAPAVRPESPVPALDAGIVEPIEEEPPAPASGCGDGARFQQSCYRASTATLTWQAARDACRAAGGDLVQLENAAEDEFVGTLLDVTIWIGASDEEFENFMQWTDGSAVSFANWAPGQPDLFQGPDCVEKRQEAPDEPWYDQPCSSTRSHVCEYEPTE